ncbi:MAG: hypothetical protein RLZZ593_397, partial [Bacteroidota bacterium]
DYAVDYFKQLKATYGKGRERQTEIRVFDDIEATKVVNRNAKLYVNREEGFVGTSLKKDEYVADCSDIDDIIVFTREGKMTVTKVDAKTFVGKDIIHVAVFKKKDTRTVYNMVYRDGLKGASYIKRFTVTGVTRDKPYELTTGQAGSEVLYFSANPNGEAEVITVQLRAMGTIKKLRWDLDFSEILIKGRESKGNTVTKYAVKRIELKEKGMSTLKPRNIWFDEVVQRLNVDGRGTLLGAFKGNDLLLLINQKGILKTVSPDLSLHFEENMIVLEQWNPKKPISVIYYEGAKQLFYVKRFVVDQPVKEELIISDHPDSYLELVSTDWRPVVELVYAKERGKEVKPAETIALDEFIGVKGIKAMGNMLTKADLKSTALKEPLAYVPQEDEDELEPEDPVITENEGISPNDQDLPEFGEQITLF